VIAALQAVSLENRQTDPAEISLLADSWPWNVQSPLGCVQWTGKYFPAWRPKTDRKAGMRQKPPAAGKNGEGWYDVCRNAAQ
jgi:hypothetical protein